jgi:hypothetical protein
MLRLTPAPALFWMVLPPLPFISHPPPSPPFLLPFLFLPPFRLPPPPFHPFLPPSPLSPSASRAREGSRRRWRGGTWPRPPPSPCGVEYAGDGAKLHRRSSDGGGVCRRGAHRQWCEAPSALKRRRRSLSAWSTPAMARCSFGALAAAEELEVSCGDIRGAPRGDYGRCFSIKKKKSSSCRE